MPDYRRKLIEVALPLEAINKESAREKSIRHGHPSTLHLWWARRPLAACRAVLFASLVDDPSSRPDKFPTEEAQDRERQRLFRLIEELVKWENTNNETVLNAARAEILKSTDGNPPPVLDPFCGGGSIPLEAQRLGLKAYASDLNPVAVLITKALIEIPPRFAGQPPVNPEYREQSAGARTMQDDSWSGARGLAEDVRYYGQWMRDEAEKRIGHLYPKIAAGSAGVPPAFSAHDEALAGKMPALPGPSPKGYYTRGYIPHFDQPGLVQMITFRLADALPASKRVEWEHLLKITDEQARREKIEHYIDAGHGSCSLQDERIARLVENALFHFDDQRYRLLAWVIMPNHVHVLIETLPGYSLAQILHSWKSFTAKEANKILGQAGDFWQPEYFDRFIRNEKHLESAVNYIHNNPVKASLVEKAEDWPYSSAAGNAAGSAPGSAGILPASGTQLSKGAGGTPALPSLTVIAWLWARTVKCPNPACGATMPLVRSFELSKKKSNRAWVEPVIDRRNKTVQFRVNTGKGSPPDPPKIGRGAKFQCLVCGEAADDQHIKDEGMAGRMDAQLMAIVAEGPRGRAYLSPEPNHDATARQAVPTWKPEYPLSGDKRAIWCPLYGLDTFDKLFTPRQLVALTTFSDLVGEAREKARQDAIAAGLSDDGVPLNDGGKGAAAYADGIATYLGFTVSRLANRTSTICFWDTERENVQQVFARQALPMTWDFVESNPFSNSSGNWLGQLRFPVENIKAAPAEQYVGTVVQLDAAQTVLDSQDYFLATDPPYYDNIGYADLSDFFYVWLRRCLNQTFTDLFCTLLTPKSQELVAIPYRFGGDRESAQHFFETGLGRAFRLFRERVTPDCPMALFYAFKQTESEQSDSSSTQSSVSTGWETMLDGLIAAGFQITGTWPMRTELVTNLKSTVNALAASIVLACRPRYEDASLATRREFTATLRRELPAALSDLQQGNVVPVDFAQAAIGPGMAIFSRYAKVLEADGDAMRVRTALQLINEELDLYLAEQEGDFDGDTRFCIAWFEQHGLQEGPFGEADVLARAKNTAVDGLVRAGVLEARAGKVRLLRREEYPDDWNPVHDSRLTVWECAQHLIRALEQGGEDAAARLAQRLGGGRSEEARALAYRLYAICERKGWSQEALAYNALVAAWGDVQAKTASGPLGRPEQDRLL